jgi:hypothetical protein
MSRAQFIVIQSLDANNTYSNIERPKQQAPKDSDTMYVILLLKCNSSLHALIL